MGTKRGKSDLAILVMAAYAAFGFVWIAASDTLVEVLVRDAHARTVVAIWKGWVFVAASSALIYGTVRHLTGRLNASEARYRQMFAESPIPMIGLDLGARTLIDANRAACGFLGYGAEELIGKRLEEIFSDDDRGALEQRMPEIQAGFPVRGVWRMVRKDGRLLDVEVEGRSVRLGPREVRVAALTDITQRLKAEAQLLVSLDQMTQADDRLREIDRAISHDLQEPLRQITSFVQLLQRRCKGRLDAESDEYIAFAIEGVRRLKTLLIDAQRFAAPPVLQMEPVDLRALLESVLDRLHATVDKVGAVFVIGRLPTLIADAEKLELVLFALVDNALKFRRPDAPCRIAVEAGREPTAWVVEVRDNGAGIAQEYHEVIFSLFRRLHVRERISGNGTGLALARKLVEAHGGDIWIESNPGQGTTVRFRIPDGATS